MKREKESKVELKYLIRNGLKFLVKEQDWKSSQETLTIPANKIKGVLKKADINWTSSEESKSDGEGPPSPKRQRIEEPEGERIPSEHRLSLNCASQDLI